MMQLSEQINALIFAFIYGVFINILVELNYKFIYDIRLFVKVIVSFLFVLDLSLLYFLILININDGIIHNYFFLNVILGYILSKKIWNKFLKKYVKKK